MAEESDPPLESIYNASAISSNLALPVLNLALRVGLTAHPLALQSGETWRAQDKSGHVHLVAVSLTPEGLQTSRDPSFPASRMSSIAAQFVRYGKKVVAIGRNYTEHVKEFNNPPPKEPFFFLKPTTSYLPSEGQVEIPKGVLAHHEVELGLVIGTGGRDISQDAAESHIAGYALAVDMTARNMQNDVKKKGLPWSAAKGFDTFTPIGKFIPKSSISDPHDLRLILKVNGAVKQDGTTSDMIFRIPRLIEHISSIMALEEGDLILTGTPSGVGSVMPGDTVECTLAECHGKTLDQLTFTAVSRNEGYRFKL